MNKRTAGVLLHITSLPSKHGVGTLGEEAYNFIDWLEKSKIHLWQVLPLVPTNYGDSPYQSVSSTAVNYYLIDFDILHKKKLLKKCEYENTKFSYSNKRVDYSLLFERKIPILKLAFSRFDKNNEEFNRFVSNGDHNDFAIFMTIKELHNHKAWTLWDEKYKKYSKELEEQVKKDYLDNYLFWIWTQYEFLEEWKSLKNYANKKQISIMGDIPLYVAYDSVEVWKYKELFILNEDHSLKLVAGCPPDCFTEDGQLWGNPVYDWEYQKEEGYSFWNNRINKSFELYDYLRIDHFRGFDRFYAIPASHTNARLGSWMDGPKFSLFDGKENLNIVAEDLGFIDEGVRTLMKQTGYPGMKILEFAFDGSPINEHKPTNTTENFCIYTGTHDNMPLYQYILDQDEEHFNIMVDDVITECNALGVTFKGIKTPKTITKKITELAFASKAKICIIPIQDLLCLDGTSRMNLPSTVSNNNWSFRVEKTQLSQSLSNKLKEYVINYYRD